MAHTCITDAPANPDYVHFREGFGQRFVVTVDTEEEFDWRAPRSRDDHSLAAIPALGKFQQFCEGYGVVPVYLMDYPVATAAVAAQVLGSAVAGGKAEIGVHLHPWVNPPFAEEVNERNSFPGNLPAHIEREKFEQLRNALERAFGTAPLIYRAGRYGAGANTADILAHCGLAVDSSVRSRFDYSATGGPNYRDHPLRPYWIDRARGLLELPVTTVFTGRLRRQAPWLYPRLWRNPRLRGMLSRVALMERVALTPEGVAAGEAIRAIDVAVSDGLPVLVFSFHSPSLAPGHTPYVRSHDDLDRFFDWWRRIFDHLARRGIIATSIREIMASVELAPPALAHPVLATGPEPG